MLFGLAQTDPASLTSDSSLIAPQSLPAETVNAPNWFQEVGGVITPYLPVFFAAFLGALVFTPIMRRLAIRHGIVDKPNDPRKIHKAPIAYLGGVAIFIGWVMGVCTGLFTEPHSEGVDRVEFPVGIIYGAVAILVTGLFDDVWEISPRVKIGGQLFAAAALASQDVGTQLVSQSIATVQSVVLANLGLPEATEAFLLAEPHSLIVYAIGTATIAIIVIGSCNAVNLIDGMDGLAAGTSSVSAIGFLLIAAILAIQTPLEYVDPIRIVMSLAMLGCLLGFLPYNFNPANIFMGDAGSLFVGYLSAASILLFSYNTDGGALKYTTACLLVMAFPITDTSLAIFRRKMAGKPLFSPDAQHIHHILKKAGFGVKPAVLIMYFYSAVFMLLGVAMVAVSAPFRVLLAVAMVLYAFIFVTAYKFGLSQAAAAKEANEQAHEPDVANSSEKPGAPPANPAVSTSNATGSA